jgi:hypothetical protein
MLPRRSAVLAALTAALFAAVGAEAAPGIDPQVLQCDGTYSSGDGTHAPYTMPLAVKAIVQDTGPGLRVGPAAPMGQIPTHTLGLWRFDSAAANVTIAPTCASNVWTYTYNYSDADGSSPMVVGICTYNAASCTNGVAVGSVVNTQIPINLGTCPNPGTLTSVPPAAFTLFPADAHFATAGNGSAPINSVHFGSVTYNSPTGKWDLPPTYTLSAWIKSSAGGNQTVLSQQGPAGKWGFGLSGGALRSFDSRDTVVGTQDVSLGSGLNDGGWHQITVMRNNSTQRRYYIDGQLVGTQTATSTGSFSGNPISHPLIVGNFEGGTEPFTGSIDEIRVLDTLMSDDDIYLEYFGTVHQYSSNGGATFSNVTGSYSPAASNGATTPQTYLPGQTPTSTSVWIFKAQNLNSATTVGAHYQISVDSAKPSVSGLSVAPTSTNDLSWSWGAPGMICVFPGTPAPGPYYQLINCGTGAVDTPPSTVFEPTRLIGSNYPGAPNQVECRQLRLTDVWGTSPLSNAATTYTLAAAPSAVSFTPASISTGGFVVSWTTNGNSAFTRYEVSYALNPAYTLGLTTRSALTDNLTANTISLTGLSGGTTYYVRVRAYNGKNGDFYGGLPTAFASANVVTDPPAPVLSATGQSNSSILWSWTSVSGASGYSLFDSSNQNLLFSGGGTSSLVSSLAVNTRYDAEVEADLPAPTLPSVRGHAFAYTLANPPVALSALKLYFSSATFTWGANGNPGGTSYELTVASDTAFALIVATVNAGANTATASGLFPGATYYARVRAFNGQVVPTTFTGPLTFSTAGDSVLSVSSTPASPYVPIAGLLGSWQFDEGAGLTSADLSGAGNTLNFTCVSGGCSSTPTFAAGPAGLGTAASFSGLAGGVALSNSGAPFNGLSNFSVEAWVNPQSGAQLPNAGIVAVGKKGAEDFALDVSPTGSYEFLTAADIVTVATASIAVGQWTHVVGVYNWTASKALLYLNGRVVASVNVVRRTTGSGQVLSLGNRQNASAAYTLPFFGRVDAVRVVNRALSASEVMTDYSGGFVSSVTSPNSGVQLALPPNAFGAPAQIYISADPVNHPIRVSPVALAAGIAAPPAGLTQVPFSLVEVVPVVNGVAYTSTLGSSATLSIPYNDSDGNNLIDGTNPPLAASRMRMYTLNTTINNWELLPTTIDKNHRMAGGVTPHFSVFALFAPVSVGAGLAGVKAYPVPWKPGSGGRFDGPGVSFANLPPSGHIRILTLAGHKVHEFSYSGANAGVATWDGNNDDGLRTASGVYFAKITSDTDASTIVVKFAVER